MAQTADPYTAPTSPSSGRSVSRLYTSALYLWVNATGAAVAGFAFWTVIARLYDADDVGLGSAALSILALLGMFCHLGLGMGLIRFLSESTERGPRLANAVFTIAAVAALVLSIVFLVGLPWWAPSLDFLRENALYALAIISFVVAATLYTVQYHAFMAIRRANYILLQTVFVLLSRLALAVLMASFFGAFGVVASWGIAVALGTALGFALMMRGLSGYRPAAVVDPRAIAKLIPFSLANHAADSLLMMPGLLLPLLVVSLLGPAEGAYFYMAWFLGYLLISASAYLALSLFTEGSYDPESLHSLSRSALAGGLAVATVGAAFLFLFGDKLLLAFGKDYAAEGATLLRIVAIAAIPAAAVNVYLGALRVTKRVGELVIIASVVATTTLVLSAALLPAMGLVGAGVGLGIGQTLGLTIVLSRLLRTAEGTVPQRMRSLVVALAGRS